MEIITSFFTGPYSERMWALLAVPIIGAIYFVLTRKKPGDTGRHSEQSKPPR